MIARLNQGTDWAGKTLGGATNYTIGVALNPVADDLDYEIERFLAKVEAGAHFAMTQPLFDPAHWRSVPAANRRAARRSRCWSASGR